MSYAAIAKSAWAAATLGTAALLASFGFGAGAGLSGMALGLGGAMFGTAALWLAIRQMGALAAQGQTSRQGTLLAVVAFGLKIPFYLVLWHAAQGIGGAASTCFVAGVVLVYFYVVARASAS